MIDKESNSIFVKIAIHGSLDQLWHLTQTPDAHQRWDIRFTDIAYLPRPDPEQPQRFRYATRIGFGMKIEGEGETIGNQSGRDGPRTSALTFWSADPKSLIREGSGYWKYTPTLDSVQFETGYDYAVRYGAAGRLFDRFVFRPLLGWATAWSFDRLRLWIEKAITPETSLQNSLIHALARLTIAFVWIYHGLVPKLLLQQADEISLLQDAGLPASAVNVLGLAEIVIGLFMLIMWRQQWLFLLTAVLMVLATLGVAISSPSYLVAAFNPLTLNLLMLALSIIGYLASNNLPSASRCLRKRGKDV